MNVILKAIYKNFERTMLDFFFGFFYKNIKRWKVENHVQSPIICELCYCLIGKVYIPLLNTKDEAGWYILIIRGVKYYYTKIWYFSWILLCIYLSWGILMYLLLYICWIFFYFFYFLLLYATSEVVTDFNRLFNQDWVSFMLFDWCIHALHYFYKWMQHFESFLTSLLE